MKDKKLFDRIKKIVSRIAKGKVATYGQIASMAGISDARVVGWALSGNHDPKVPCHRVLKKGGFIVQNYAFGDWEEERKKLLAEGIIFKKEKQVDIERHLWDGKFH